MILYLDEMNELPTRDLFAYLIEKDEDKEGTIED